MVFPVVLVLRRPWLGDAFFLPLLEFSFGSSRFGLAFLGVKSRFPILFLLVMALAQGCSRQSEPLPRPRDINVLLAVDPREEAFIREQIQDFEGFNWNAKVRLHVRPRDFPLAQELERMESKGQPVDLICFEASELPALIASGRLTKMTRDDRAKKMSGEILPDLKEKIPAQNDLHAFPFFWSTQVLVYNKKIFDGIGISYPSGFWGWPDVLEAAQAAAQDTDRDGKIDQFGIELQSQAGEVVMMFWQFEGLMQPGTDSLEKGLDAENRRILDQTVDFYSDLDHEMKVSTINKKGIQGGFFESGRAAVTFAQWRDVFALMDSPRKALWQIAPVPRGREKATLLEARLLAIPSASSRKTEAMSLAGFLLRSEAQKQLVEKGVGLPVLTALRERTIEGGRGTELDMEAFYEQLPDAQIAPPPALMSEIQKLLDTRLSGGGRIVPDSTERPSFRSRLKLRLEPPNP